MAPTWTDATTVRERIDWGTATLISESKAANLQLIEHVPTNAEINTMIEEAEQYLCAVVRDNLLTSLTFDATKHGILSNFTNAYVAAMIVAENPGLYDSASEASLAADIQWSLAKEAEEILKNQDTILYLKGL